MYNNVLLVCDIVRKMAPAIPLTSSHCVKLSCLRPSRHRASFAARDLHVGGFLGLRVVVTVEIVSGIVIMVPSCTVELNKLMNDLEISELEVSFEFARARTFCRLCRSLSTRSFLRVQR